jgi:hypothetical protein
LISASTRYQPGSCVTSLGNGVGALYGVTHGCVGVSKMDATFV